MVQVGLARPHGADRLVGAVELVEPGSVDVIHHRAVRVLEERRIPLGVRFLAGHAGERGGRVDALGQRPMHTVVHDGLAVPVGGVYEAGRTVRVPRILDRTVEQMLRGVDVRGRGRRIGRIGAGGPLGDQAGPFDAVARSRAVRLELVVRLLAVAFEVERPVGMKVFGDAPVVGLRPAEHVLDDAARALAPGLVAGHVGHGEERLDGMHVGVEAAVRVEFGEFGVPRVDGQAGLVVPELVEEDLFGMVEQFGGTGATEQGRGR